MERSFVPKLEHEGDENTNGGRKESMRTVKEDIHYSDTQTKVKGSGRSEKDELYRVRQLIVKIGISIAFESFTCVRHSQYIREARDTT